MESCRIIPMAERVHRDVPLDKIKVLNSRSREKVQFEENVRSIKEVGLMKAVVVNERYLEKTGFYELVCGQGRYLAYKELGKTAILAEVIDCSKPQAHLISLVENIARIMPDTMWFAREIKRLRDAGWSTERIGNLTGRSAQHIRDYIRLVEQGEEWLIRGVEKNLFPISFAIRVAQSDDADIQRIMMDAYDGGIVHTSTIETIRKILEARKNNSKAFDKGHPPGGKALAKYSVEELNADINRITKEKEAFVKESSHKENRLLVLIEGVNALIKHPEVAALIKAEGLDQRPQLKGSYNV